MKLTRFYPLLLMTLCPLSPSADEAPQLPPAILELLQKAESGDAEAQNMLGEDYNNGDGVEMDEAKAVYWFKLSAEQGNADGLCNLGECYLKGYGIDRTGHEKEYDELAVKYFAAAMEGGSLRAYCMMATCHLFSRGGLVFNMGKARDLLQYAADRGYEDAKKTLFMFQIQDGIFPNQEDNPAAEIYQQLWEAYQQGNETPELLVHIAYCYQMGINVESDIDKAIELYKKAADQGNPMAQFALSMLLVEDGELAESNKELSDQYLNKAAEQGSILAYAALLNQDNDPEKLEFIKKSAEKGDTLAQVVLGGYYYDQPDDIRKQAIVWWEKAAEQGLALAEYQLGICYDEGDLVEKDVKKALDYWRRASSHGFTEAQLNLLNFFRNNGTEHTNQEELDRLRSTLEKKGLHREDAVNSNVISNLLAWLYDALSIVLSKFA